jgi:phosphohistidine phosphatase
MRYLTLFRHAKSDWSSGVKDHDRTLAPRGLANAPRMARWLAGRGHEPERILCSSSQRTRETLDLALTEWQNQPEVHYDRGLYLSSQDKIIQLIGEHGDTAENIMVVGHNPDMHDLVLDLVDPMTEDAVIRRIGKYPTAAMAVLACDVANWNELTNGNATLKMFMKPGDLDA